MRVSVALILVAIGTCSAVIPDIAMALHMPVQVSFVFEAFITLVVFAHEKRLSGMGDLVLDKSALKWK